MLVGVNFVAIRPLGPAITCHVIVNPYDGGRIYEVGGGPEHLRWFWALHFPSKPENLRTDNRVATLEATEVEFEASWRQWLAWAKLEEVD